MATAITDATSAADIDAVRRLFTDYAAWLDRDHGISLAFQDIESELATLPGKYAPPSGALLLACRTDGAPAGCAALRPFGPGTCEIKRLYVAPEARGTGLGRTLAERILARAVALGYRRAVLDTTSFMDGAQHLYRSLGFRDIEPYYANPYAVARYLGRDLP